MCTDGRTEGRTEKSITVYLAIVHSDHLADIISCGTTSVHIELDLSAAQLSVDWLQLTDVVYTQAKNCYEMPGVI